MSTVAPMPLSRRAENYLRQRQGGGMTPRQWRRWRHKFSRFHGASFGHWGDKRQMTPRQIKRRPRRPERAA